MTTGIASDTNGSMVIEDQVTTPEPEPKPEPPQPEPQPSPQPPVQAPVLTQINRRGRNIEVTATEYLGSKDKG